MRRLILLASAAAPALMPLAAQAETSVADDRTTPIATATIGTGNTPDSIKITTEGSVIITGAGPAVQINSAHDVNNEGAIRTNATSNSVTVQLNGGFVGADFLNKGIISNLEDFTPDDTDDDGDTDGPFAQGTNRVGVLITGASAFTGNITQNAGASVTIEGNDSSGWLFDAPVVGVVNLKGNTSVVGNDSYAVRVVDGITGNVTLEGGFSALGEDSVGVAIDGDITGKVRIAGSLSARGYRFTSRPDDATILKLDADDKLQGGSALLVTSNITGGIQFDVRPTDTDGDNEDTDDKDEDDDGILDAEEGSSSISNFGSAPTVQIGRAADPNITIGVVGTGALNYGVVNKGSMTASGLLDTITSTALRTDNATFNGLGIFNSGALTAQTFDANAQAVALGAGSVMAGFNNDGALTGAAISDLTTVTAYGLLIEDNAAIGAGGVTNSGTIRAIVAGEGSDAVAIRDLSDSVRLITNSGDIFVQRTLTDDAKDLDDTNTDPSDEEVTGDGLAIDLSTQTIGSTIIQRTFDDEDTPSIVGDIRLGAGGDTLDIRAGQVVGNIEFGGGSDTLVITGESSVVGELSDSGGGLAINVTNGLLSLRNDGALNLSTLNVGEDGQIALLLDPENNTNASFNVAGAAVLDEGSEFTLVLQSIVEDQETFNLITAGSLTGGSVIELVNSPFLYAADQTVTATTLDITLRRKNATELGLNANQTAAYEPLFDSIAQDDALIAPILGLTSQATLQAAFEQFLPNTTGAEAELAMSRAELLSSMIFERHVGFDRSNREVFLWAHEMGYRIDRDLTPEGQGIEGFGFGFAAGIDGPMGDNGYKGFGFSYTSGEIDEKEGFDDPLTMSSFEGFVHAAQPLGPVIVAARLGASYDRYESNRLVKITSDANPNLITQRQADADWTGYHVSASLRAALPTKMGWLDVRPEAGVQFIALWEDAYEESGGGGDVELSVDKRDAMRATASAAVAVGHVFKPGQMTVTPEVRVGATYKVMDDPFETRARFLSGGPEFTMESDSADDAAALLGLSITAAGSQGSVRAEGQVEAGDQEVRTSGRLVVRLTF